MTGANEVDSGSESPPTAAGSVSVPESTLRQYRRFSLYNSPYPAHDSGCAVDLYPGTNEGLSPVAGEVLETRTVRAPDRPYAHDEEYLILVDVDVERSGLHWDGSSAPDAESDGLVARILHVRPGVAAGDTVAVGDSLGELIRSGFFAPWVANHVHLGFRRRGQNLHRADGSLPVTPAVDVVPVAWDGIGTVVETGPTYARLDAPEHPDPGERFAAIAGRIARGRGVGGARRRSPADGERVALDGGLAHYARGGVLTRDAGDRAADGNADGTISFLDHSIGDASGRNAAWREVDVVANGARITGVSLFAGIDSEFGTKLVCPDRNFAKGQQVRVAIRDSDDPIRLG